MEDASSPIDAPDDAAPDHVRARLRGPKRLLLVGPVVALLAAFGSGLLGMDGRVGFFLFLLLLAVTFGLTGLWVGMGLLLDEFRGAPTGGRRGLLTALMFFAALVCMTAAGGIGASSGSGT